MSDIPEGLQYTPEHEYVRETDTENELLIGITDFAQGELGDVVYVELPEPGDEFGQAESFGTVEAVKTVAELYSPAAGEVVEVNEALEADPSLVNSDPYGEGWMIRLRVSPGEALDSLLTAAEYRSLLEEEGGEA
ncbi:MAG: glycine cleavage system protein GcvH [Gemmatimonadota bacterium]|nr:glycine cleavage system protein GcvH [Gemmatimonadota bacterium]